MSTVQEKVDADENDLQKLVNYLQRFILKRGWRLKIAKKTQVEQSLFIHAINELGAIQNYLQVYPHPYNMSELKKIYIASILHDCEKETTEWQEKVRLGEKPPHHTNPEYAKMFINKLINFLDENGIALDLSQDDVNDIISSQPLHMTGASKNPHIVFEELSRKHKSERWSEIANLIDLFDDIVSIEAAESSIELLNTDKYKMLAERIEFRYHKVSNVRGILSSLLHKACEKVYEKHGFIPFLYYVDSTLYFRQRRDPPNDEIYVREIESMLIAVINEFISKIDSESEIASVIGRPQTKMLLMKEFLRRESIERYFAGIGRKYKNTRKSDKTKLKEVIEHHFGSLKDTKTVLKLEYSKDADLIDLILSNIGNYYIDYPDFCKEFQLVLNASISRPQQYMFQFFKEIAHELLKDEKLFQESAMIKYDSIFGDGAYELLKSKSTTMPYTQFDRRKNKQLPGDFERYIEPYWKKQIETNGEKIMVKDLPLDKQENLLAENLSNILKDNIGTCSKLPKDIFFTRIANLLISDLIYPLPFYEDSSENFTEIIRTLAEREIASIGGSKEKLFNETKGQRLCPLCHKLMTESNSLFADLLSNDQGIAKVFNNQATGAGRFQTSVNICLLCHAELLLRRVLLGKTPSDIIILFPSLNFTRAQGSKVLEDMKDIQNKLGQFFSYHNPDLNFRAQLNNLRNISTQILEESAEEISAELDPDKFIESFTVKISDETRKNDLKKLENKIMELYSIEEFNTEFQTDYDAFKEIAEDIFENKIKMPETERNQLIEDSGINTIRYSFVYETSNFIVISLPITFTHDEEESEVNILLKRVLFASYLYLLTDCSAMVVPGKEVIHIPQTRNMVYVQPNSTLKQVIKDDWISLFDLKKWLVAISIAIKLSYEGGYSSRSGIFEVLNQPTVGHILSRITSQKTPSGATKRADARLINILDKLQHSEVLRNETIVNSKI